MQHVLRTTVLGLVLSTVVSCAVRHVPIQPVLDPKIDAEMPRLPGQVVAVVMDPTVANFRRDRDFSLFQQERYSSGEHFMRSLLAQLRARGLVLLEVESEEQARQLAAPFVLIPDAPGIQVIRPKGLLDFSFLGSLNRISVSYSVRLLQQGARFPERVSGSSSRTASFFWSNAVLQSIGLTILGSSASFVIYGAWFAWVVSSAVGRNQRPNANVGETIKQLAPPLHVAVAVFVADHLLSQAIAQVVPRVINPLVDVLINEPRWQVMVQSAHDGASEDLANELVNKIAQLAKARRAAQARESLETEWPEARRP